MAKSKKACEHEEIEVERQMPNAYYPLHSLLHTLRELQAHEDHICTLLTEMQRSGKVTASLRRDLSAFLSSFPAASLEQEVEALCVSLSANNEGVHYAVSREQQRTQRTRRGRKGTQRTFQVNAGHQIRAYVRAE